VIRDLRAADPREVGHYQLLGRLGTGGMGQVYLARSPGGRLVAVKVIRPELAEERGFRARFAREVAAARLVSGLFTAALVDADPEAETPWMATAYVPGPSLADAVEDHGPLPESSVLALAAGLAEALHAIHSAGVVHRDLKPSNVLLADDGPRVIDFGISRAAERSILTTSGSLMGSPGFLSPEQAEGRPVAAPSDVFSLGAVLTYAATGDGPFGSGPTPALLYRVVNTAPELSRVPRLLRPVLERCLAKDPSARPSLAELLAEFSAQGEAMTSQWLPTSVIATLDRYSTAMPGLPEVSRTATTPGAAPPSEIPADVSLIDTQTVHVAVAPASDPSSGQKADERAPEPGPLAPPLPAAPVNTPGPRRRWPIVAGVAAVTAAIVIPILALSPAGPPRATASSSPPAARLTARSSSPPAATAVRHPGSTPIRGKTANASKPARSRTPTPTTPSPTMIATPVAATTQPASSAPTQPTTPPATTPKPKPTPTPTPTHSTQPPKSGPQTITSATGVDWISCSDYGGLESSPVGSPVSYAFANNSDADITVWYISTTGTGSPTATIAPGHSYSPRTFVGDDWMVTGSGGGCLEIFGITATSGTITVG
jgi:eukaryotic-like serine/threonine-protein kinase